MPAVADLPPVAGQWLDRPAGLFGHLAGRTPVPAATVAVDRVSGELPPFDRPDDASALKAVQLVLGRYCLQPDGYELTLAPLDG